ncbi:MAG: phage regulatory protein/antirepressor Ant [Nocardiaceae bacterium]|nr:phage regulatory protein/antirepressor Ant [Nocardiaceae bacterium]
MSDVNDSDEGFVAIERTSPIVQMADGAPTTTSMRVANGTGVQHKNVLELVRNNLADFEEFGLVAFQTRPRPEGQHGGGDIQIAILNEEHATLLLTYMRNSEIVRDFKKRLVREFYEMRKRLATPMTANELMAAGFAEAMKQLEQRDARIYQLEAKANVDAPKVTYVDTYVTDADLLSFSTVASSNNVGEKWLRELLIAKGWIYVQSDSRWSEKEQKKVVRNRYSEKADKKRYFRRVEVHEAPRFRGSEVMHTLKVTPQGAEAIARLIAKGAAA